MSAARTGVCGPLIASLALIVAGICAPAAAADAARGKVLYETRCAACHASSVHNRNARKAKTFQALRAQVRRWSVEAGGSWSADEVDDVTIYLNRRYYRFPCPPGVCASHQASNAP